MRTSPRPPPSSIASYYPPDYAPHRQGAGVDPLPRRGGLRAALRRFLELEDRILPVDPPGRLIEVGCASGQFLLEARDRGWIVSGIEFSSSAALEARRRGLDVQEATIESARSPSQPARVIAAWMVLEHLHNPVAALQRLRSWVETDGWLVASVPDAGSLESRVFGNRWYALQLPTHLFHYTPASLQRVLEAAGWKVERIRWQRNCNNLFWSLQYLLEDYGLRRCASLVSGFRVARHAAPVRDVLAVLLGFLRQSGRIEVWARPDQPK